MGVEITVRFITKSTYNTNAVIIVYKRLGRFAHGSHCFRDTLYASCFAQTDRVDWDGMKSVGALAAQEAARDDCKLNTLIR